MESRIIQSNIRNQTIFRELSELDRILIEAMKKGEIKKVKDKYRKDNLRLIETLAKTIVSTSAKLFAQIPKTQFTNDKYLADPQSNIYEFVRFQNNLTDTIRLAIISSHDLNTLILNVERYLCLANILWEVGDYQSSYSIFNTLNSIQDIIYNKIDGGLLTSIREFLSTDAKSIINSFYNTFAHTIDPTFEVERYKKKMKQIKKSNQTPSSKSVPYNTGDVDNFFKSTFAEAHQTKKPIVPIPSRLAITIALNNEAKWINASDANLVATSDNKMQPEREAEIKKQQEREAEIKKQIEAALDQLMDFQKSSVMLIRNDVDVTLATSLQNDSHQNFNVFTEEESEDISVKIEERLVKENNEKLTLKEELIDDILSELKSVVGNENNSNSNGRKMLFSFYRERIEQLLLGNTLAYRFDDILSSKKLEDPVSTIYKDVLVGALANNNDDIAQFIMSLGEDIFDTSDRYKTFCHNHQPQKIKNSVTSQSFEDKFYTLLTSLKETIRGDEEKDIKGDLANENYRIIEKLKGSIVTPEIKQRRIPFLSTQTQNPLSPPTSPRVTRMMSQVFTAETSPKSRLQANKALSKSETDLPPSPPLSRSLTTSPPLSRSTPPSTTPQSPQAIKRHPLAYTTSLRSLPVSNTKKITTDNENDMTAVKEDTVKLKLADTSNVNQTLTRKM